MAIIEVVKYDGAPSVFIYKYPNTELGTWTQLIVNESQEAILFKGGQALDVFGPGRHTLDTDNIPILNNIINIPFGGKSPFTAEVWYINKVSILDIKWGTPTPIQIQDPKYNVFIPLRAYGQFGFKIIDAKLFLKKVVGTLSSFSSDDLAKYFRGIYLTEVKDHISEYLIQKKISVLEINSFISEISEELKNKIRPYFEEYGVELINFYVNDINMPENDSAVIKLKDALAKKAEMDIIGYSYQQERSFNTLEGAAKNTGSESANLMGAGIGMSMGLGIGGQFGNSLGNVSQNLNLSETKTCPHCNNQLNTDNKFCPHCGKEANAKTENNITCDKCGTSNISGVKFCSECGNKLFNTCNKCGEILKNNQKFCPNCGTSTAKDCPGCGTKITDSSKFCPECGTKVEV